MGFRLVVRGGGMLVFCCEPGFVVLIFGICGGLLIFEEVGWGFLAWLSWVMIELVWGWVVGLSEELVWGWFVWLPEVVLELVWGWCA